MNYICRQMVCDKANNHAAGEKNKNREALVEKRKRYNHYEKNSDLRQIKIEFPVRLKQFKKRELLFAKISLIDSYPRDHNSRNSQEL